MVRDSGNLAARKTSQDHPYYKSTTTNNNLHLFENSILNVNTFDEKDMKFQSYQTSNQDPNFLPVLSSDPSKSSSLIQYGLKPSMAMRIAN